MTELGTPSVITEAMREGTLLADQVSFALGFVCGELNLEEDRLAIIANRETFDLLRSQANACCWLDIANDSRLGHDAKTGVYHGSLAMGIPSAPPGLGILRDGELIGGVTFSEELGVWASYHRQGGMHIAHPVVFSTKRAEPI